MTRRELIRVLVIDDSAFSRQTITRLLQTSPLIEVVGVARDGEDALRKTLELQPDLVTLDLEMPRMDGFTFLRLVMTKRPTPVLVISGHAGEQDVFKALTLGAADFVAKPTSHATPELETIREELIGKVHAIRELRIENLSDPIEATAPVSQLPSACGEAAAAVVAIGSSTGGPSALMKTLTAFRAPPPCSILVAQHMPAGFTAGFASRLDRLTQLDVAEAAGGEVLTAGSVWIAPGGSHLEVEAHGGRFVTRVVASRDGERYTPSVDRLFETAAKHVGADLLAIVLTGMGSDGCRGAAAVKRFGGRVIAESEQTAVIFGMPKKVIESGSVDRVVPLHDIPEAIQSGLPGADEDLTGRRGLR